jgi:O-antigen/teichoic acid export membrane protein
MAGTTARTAGYNVAAAAAAATGGVLVARAVGPVVRGEYAAVIAWFGVLLVAGEVGQTAAVCFYVARDPMRARGYVATARGTMLATGAIALATGYIAAPALGHGDPGLTGAYRLAFSGSVIAFTGASYTFALQARSIGRWNLVRFTQPAVGLAGLAVLWQLRMLSLQTAVGALIGSMTIQLCVAYYWCRRCDLAPGCAQPKFAWPLLKYGLSQLAAVAPTSVNAYLDQLLLSQVAAPAALGSYAIAVSVAGIPVPLVSAIGSVAFPRLAAQGGAAAQAGRIPRVALLTSAGMACAVLLPVAASARWLIPLAFGAAYRPAVPLVWILAPGGVFLASGQVAGELLRGLGRPGLVAAAQGLAAVFTVILLFTLLPIVGVAAAAIASTIAYGVALAVMTGWLWRPPPARRKPARTGGGRHRQRAAGLDRARDLP